MTHSEYNVKGLADDITGGLVPEAQKQLRAAIKSSPFSFEDVAFRMGYANRSAISVCLVKERLSIAEIVGIMTSIGLKTLSFDYPFPVRISLEYDASDLDGATSHLPALIAALRESILIAGRRNTLVNKISWETVAERTGLFADRRSARKSWFLYHTIISYALPLLLVLGITRHQVGVEGLSMLIEMELIKSNIT